jgi:hypothetical protein
MMSGITLVEPQAIFNHIQHMTCTSMFMREGKVVMVMEGVDLPVTELVFDPMAMPYCNCYGGRNDEYFVLVNFEEH